MIHVVRLTLWTRLTLQCDGCGCDSQFGEVLDPLDTTEAELIGAARRLRMPAPHKARWVLVGFRDEDGQRFLGDLCLSCWWARVRLKRRRR